VADVLPHMPAQGREPADHQRLADLFAAHAAELLAYARRRGARPADAEDVVAETFVVAWRRFDDLPEEAARAWLFGIARRVLANQVRSAARRAPRSGRLPDEIRAPGGPVGLDEDLAAVLDALPPADREVLQLTAWEDLRPAELAVVLGISANAAAIRLHRARLRFAQALAKASADGNGSLKGSRWVRTLRWVQGSLAGSRREVE